MATETLEGVTTHDTEILRLASPNGVVTREVLLTPLRDALPSEIPIIDISSAFKDSIEDRQAVAAEIRKAATTTGFFYIKNHGVPETVIENVYHAGLDFFRQDLESKLRAKTSGSSNFAGYFPPRSMKINPFEGQDVKEMFITRYDPHFDPSLSPLDVENIPQEAKDRFHYQDTPWEGTLSVPHFKPAMIAYYQEGLKLTRTLMRSFALSLDLEEDYFDDKMRYPNINTNINYYRAAPKVPDPSSPVSAFGSHTDFQVITVLWQDEVGGLQVLNGEGQWINVPPIPGTFVVNIADLLQRITNDVYKSTIHRAQNRSGRDRVSMPFATGFGAHTKVAVVESCTGPDNPKKYSDITVEEWVTTRLSNMIRLSKELDNEEQAV